MSVLGVGSRCASCATVDFLPSTCPNCQQTFCGAHLLTHTCATSSAPFQHGGPSVFRPKASCEREGCERPRIEAIAGVDADSSTEGIDVKIAKQVRCHGCGGAFCTAYVPFVLWAARADPGRHRAQTSHDCTAPLDFTARQDAAVLRKARAQEVLARTMPAHTGKIIAKPPPGRDVERIRPEPKPSEHSPKTAARETPGLALQEKQASKVKSKAEKLYEMHLRKLRSLAKPLDSSQKGEGERRFFEWAVDERGEVLARWEKEGKWDGKVERVWVMADTPCGKVLDLTITQSKISRPKDPIDPQQALRLMSLCSLPDQAPAQIPLDLSRPVSTVPEGSLVVLTRGDPP